MHPPFTAPTPLTTPPRSLAHHQDRLPHQNQHQSPHAAAAVAPIPRSPRPPHPTPPHLLQRPLLDLWRRWMDHHLTPSLRAQQRQQVGLEPAPITLTWVLLQLAFGSTGDPTGDIPTSSFKFTHWAPGGGIDKLLVLLIAYLSFDLNVCLHIYAYVCRCTVWLGPARARSPKRPPTLIATPGTILTATPSRQQMQCTSTSSAWTRLSTRGA